MKHKIFLFSPQTGATPLYIASEKNNVDVVGLLLASGANADLATEVRHKLKVPTYSSFFGKLGAAIECMYEYVGTFTYC